MARRLSERKRKGKVLRVKANEISSKQCVRLCTQFESLHGRYLLLLTIHMRTVSMLALNIAKRTDIVLSLV